VAADIAPLITCCSSLREEAVQQPDVGPLWLSGQVEIRESYIAGFLTQCAPPLS